MARYLAQALVMSEEFWRGESGYGYGPVGHSGNYQSREEMVVEADSPEWACEKVWMANQNIDENRRVPGGGRSMMVGDLVLLSAYGEPDISLWQAVSCGFKRVEFPNVAVGEAA